ncbi:MAG: FAD-dependent oxidoreductase [Acidobacteriota bacterium]|nr:FAD-dependent oxidoreductase [Acidobacteriota bacterium]
MTAYPNLFSELRVGPCTIENRIVSSGHDTVMVDHGEVTDQLIAYHEARAAGGVGLIVVQVAGVHESARYTAHVLMATDDSCVPGFARLAGALHAHGTKVFGQLFHPGREVMESQDGSRPVAVAPSAVPNERFRVMPRALGAGEVAQIVDGYASAAQRMARAGLDGVEVVASHGYLPAQFLNAALNHREDAYGGSEENRRRFLREVLAAVRERVGGGVAVGLRISIGERDPSGLDEATALAACAALSREGLVDYVSVTTGTSAGLAGSDHIAPEMGFANGYTAPLARRVKDLVDVPVFVAGRLNQPQEAERLLESGDADACIMTRALICDPEMARLAREGRAEEIRACVACNQACIGHFHAGYPISCIQRPETGRELVYLPRRRAAARRRVLVVGAGPAGLKAAAVAAERGHDVTVHDAAARVGGQVLLAQMLPGREEFGGVAQNLLAEARRAGARVVLSSPVDAEVVASLAPDVVVAATGARPYRPPIEVMGSPRVLDSWEVIAGAHPPAGHVVVVDTAGDWTGVGVARILAAAGHRVTLCVNGYGAGEALQQYVRDAALAALERERVRVVPLVRLFGVDDDTVYLQHVLTEEPVLEPGVAGVVLSCGHEAVTDLEASLAGRGVSVVAVGDCRAPRSVEEAVLEGLAAASEL